MSFRQKWSQLGRALTWGIGLPPGPVMSSPFKVWIEDLGWNGEGSDSGFHHQSRFVFSWYFLTGISVELRSFSAFKLMLSRPDLVLFSSFGMFSPFFVVMTEPESRALPQAPLSGVCFVTVMDSLYKPLLHVTPGLQEQSYMGVP